MCEKQRRTLSEIPKDQFSHVTAHMIEENTNFYVCASEFGYEVGGLHEKQTFTIANYVNRRKRNI